MSEQIDHDALTLCGPTELGAVVETGPQLAYSIETEVLDYPEPVSRLRVGLIAVAIVAVAGLVVGAVLFVGHSRRADPTPVAATATTTTTVAPIGAPPPPPPPPVTVTTVIVQSTVAQKAPPPPPKAARTMSMWTYDVRWGGAPGISVVEYGSDGPRQTYVVNGANLGMGNGWTGELIGVDPILEGPLTWASCTLYVDGRVAKTSFAARGDGNDVSCLVRLTH
jgi:hypothetical protein